MQALGNVATRIYRFRVMKQQETVGLTPNICAFPMQNAKGFAMSEKTVSASPDNFFFAGGTVPSDNASYVVRQADADLFENLRRGEFCYVLNSRQMGKSSLMVRTAERLKAQGVTVAVLDLTAVGQNLTPEQWYDGLLTLLAEQLRLEDALEGFWFDTPNLGPMQRFFAAIKQIALPKVQTQLILFVDEIDVVRSLPFSADEFFAGIRQCYIGRTQDEALSKIAFCLLGTATPADLIQDTRTSPFNIGRRIEIRDFTPEEAQPLAQGLGANGPALIARILHWTNGHPYLTQRLCRAVTEMTPLSLRGTSESGRGAGGEGTLADVDALCTELFLTHKAKESDDNLMFVRNRLLKSEVDLAALLDLCRRMQAGKRVPDDETNPLTSVLKLSGVARVESGDLKVRNRIYNHVFDKAWIEQHYPDAERRRVRAAVRKARLQTSLIASLIVTIIGNLAIYGFSQANLARQNAKRADENAQLAALHADETNEKAKLAGEEAQRASISEKQAMKEAQRANENAKNEKLAREEAQRTKASEETVRKKVEMLASTLKQELERSNGLTRQLTEANSLLKVKLKHQLRKEKLYRETIHTVANLATTNSQINSNSGDYKRFWDLYNRDLLDVESRDMEGQMAKIGVELKRLVAEKAPPDKELRDLSFELADIAKAELGAKP